MKKVYILRIATIDNITKKPHFYETSAHAKLTKLEATLKDEIEIVKGFEVKRTMTERNGESTITTKYKYYSSLGKEMQKLYVIKQLLIQH